MSTSRALKSLNKLCMQDDVVVSVRRCAHQILGTEPWRESYLPPPVRLSGRLEASPVRCLSSCAQMETTG